MNADIWFSMRSTIACIFSQQLYQLINKDPRPPMVSKEIDAKIEYVQEKDGINSHIQKHDGQSGNSERLSESGAGCRPGPDSSSLKGSATQGLTKGETETKINQNYEEVSSASLHSIAQSVSGVESIWEKVSLRLSGSNTFDSVPLQPEQSGRNVATTRGRTARTVQLDPNAPGAWLIKHHEQNIITKLLEPEERLQPKSKTPKSDLSNKIPSVTSDLFGSFQEWVYGTSEAKPPHSNEEAGQKEDSGGDKKIANTVNAAKPRFRVNFAELQRMKMRKLQVKLVKNAVDMCDTGSEPEEWEANLSQYVQAIKDYDYINERSQRLEDPFLASGERFVDYWVIRRAIDSTKHRQQFLARDFELAPSFTSWKGREDSNPIGGTRSDAIRNARDKGLANRITIATCAGLFLIGPMWLAVLHHTKYTALASSTFCVVLFGFFMACFLEKEIEVLSSTAAYAAVLVVVMGLNT